MAAKLTAREKQENIFVERAAQLGRECMLENIRQGERFNLTDHSNKMYHLCNLARMIVEQEDDRDNDE